MLGEKSFVVIFHTEDEGETYTRQKFINVSCFIRNGINKTSGGAEKNGAGIIRIPSKESLKIYPGDYIAINEDIRKIDFGKCKRIKTVTTNLKGPKQLWHIRIDTDE